MGQLGQWDRPFGIEGYGGAEAYRGVAVARAGYFYLLLFDSLISLSHLSQRVKSVDLASG
jgi:hypothetical protein